MDSSIGSMRNKDLARLAHEHGDLGWTLLQQLATRLVWAQRRIYDLQQARPARTFGPSGPR